MESCLERKVVRYVLCCFLLVMFLIPSALGQSELYFAQAIRGNFLNTTEIFVQNSGSTQTDVTVRFFKSDGTLEETQEIVLQPNGGDKIRLGSPELNSLSVGYAVVSAPGNVVATAFYFLQAGGESLPPIGILPETGSTNWRTFAKIEPGVVNTGIAVAIPDAGSVPSVPNCQLNLYSGVNGALAGSGPVDFGTDQQRARFITELIPEVKDGFEGPVVLSCDQPVVAAALIQESSGSLSTVAMEPSSGATEVYFAQAIRGNSLNTTEVFVQNSDSLRIDVVVRFFKSDGTLEETLGKELQPNGGAKFRLGTPHLNSLSVGYAVVLATGNVVATAFYSLEAGGESLPPIGILPETGSANWRSFAKIDPGVVNTGIAVAIPDAAATPSARDCQLRLYSGTNGTLAGSGPVDFDGNVQLARFITELIPSSKDGFEGPVVLSCDQPVVSAALIQEASGALSTVAMVPSSDDGGGGEPTSGTALLPKRVTGLNLTSDRALNQTLPGGVQITGILGSGLPAFDNITHQTAPPIPTGVNAVCNNQIYQGAVDFQGSYLIPVPKQSTCTVYVIAYHSSALSFVTDGIRAQGEQASTVLIEQKLDPPVQVSDTDVTKNFTLPTPSMEIVQGSVSGLDSLPAELILMDPALVLSSTDGDITGISTLPGGSSTRDYHLELPSGHNYIASLELFEEGEMGQATGALTSLYDIGQVNLGGDSLTHLSQTENLTANFSVPATAQLSGILSEADMSTIGEGSIVSAKDTRAPGFTEFFGGIGLLGDGFSVALPPAQGAYELALALGQQYSLIAGIALDDTRFWGVPAELEDDVITFNGAMTRNFSFPSRPPEVTLSGQVMGPDLTGTAASAPASNVSVSVFCRSLSGAAGTFFSGTTNTDGAGNYSIQVLSGSICEVEFLPALPDLGFPFPFSR